MINTTKSNTTLYLQEKDMTQISWPLQITLLDCTMILLTLQDISFKCFKVFMYLNKKLFNFFNYIFLNSKCFTSN